MNKLFIIILFLIMSGCHTTGHNPYGDNEVFNSIVITAIAVAVN